MSSLEVHNIGRGTKPRMLGYVTFLGPLIAGICLYAAVMHLQIGLKKPIDRVHALFGTLALCIVICVVGSLLLASAQTAARYQIAVWVFSVPWLGYFALFPWFVSEYSCERPRWPALTISGLYAVIFIANLLTPYSVLQADPPVLEQLALPWGEQFTRSSTPGTALTTALSCAHVLAIGYLIYACVNLFRRGLNARAWALTLSALPFLGSVIFNLLVKFGVFNFSYFGAPGLIAMVAIMSFALTREWRHTHTQMQSLLENVPAALFLKQIDGRYAFVNRHFEQMYRVSAQRTAGKTDADLFDAARAAKNASADRDALAGNLVEWEDTLDQPEGARTYAVSCVALRDADHSAYALCGIAVDITERKTAAVSLRHLAANLERRVTRRTEEVARLGQELEAITYSVSHDLRAPLTAINGFAELLLREYSMKLDQSGHRYLQRIREGSIRLGSLMQSLVGLSRISQQALERTSVNVSAVFADAVQTQRDTEPNRSVEVQIQESLAASADASLLAIVAGNLVGNAWKYTSKIASARVQFGALEGGDERVFFIKDNGAGFDPHYAERLFRPFVRLHSEQDFPGAGIGLATVARIVNRHGGRVWAEGARDQGATIYFTLPEEE